MYQVDGVHESEARLQPHGGVPFYAALRVNAMRNQIGQITALRWLLRDKSFEHTVVGITASGEDAIQLAAEAGPELVLMDIQLPGNLDGVAAAEEIYTRFSIPAIYLTAHADDCTLQRAIATNPFGYLLKPFQELELHITIQIALQRHWQGICKFCKRNSSKNFS